MKLYRINLKGLRGSGIDTAYGRPYVVADNPTDALLIVQKYLIKKDIGFNNEREMESIELLAEEGDYPKCRVQLFISDESEHRVNACWSVNCDDIDLS